MPDRSYHVDPPAAAYDGAEIVIQTLLLARARIRCPAVTFAAVPNAARRSQWAAQRAKREGMRRGFEDLVATWPGRGVAFLEIKDRDGSISIDQHEWLTLHVEQGHFAGVFRHPDTALSFLRDAGAPFLDGGG